MTEVGGKPLKYRGITTNGINDLHRRFLRLSGRLPRAVDSQFLSSITSVLFQTLFNPFCHRRLSSSRMPDLFSFRFIFRFNFELKIKLKLTNFVDWAC